MMFKIINLKYNNLSKRIDFNNVNNVNEIN